MFKSIALAAVAAVGITGAASANTITFGSNTTAFAGNIIEGGPNGYYNGAQQVNDFNTAATNPSISVSSAFTIFGSVTNQAGSSVNYVDAWEMDFGSGVYDVTWRFAETARNNVDGYYTVGGVQNIFSAGPGGMGTIALTGLTGLVSFLIDPISDPTQLSTSGTETIAWRLQIAPSPVPLPAGAVLLVGALGGLAAVRRRKTNAA